MAGAVRIISRRSCPASDTATVALLEAATESRIAMTSRARSQPPPITDAPPSPTGSGDRVGTSAAFRGGGWATEPVIATRKQISSGEYKGPTLLSQRTSRNPLLWRRDSDLHHATRKRVHQSSRITGGPRESRYRREARRAPAARIPSNPSAHSDGESMPRAIDRATGPDPNAETP